MSMTYTNDFSECGFPEFSFGAQYYLYQEIL